MERTAMNAVEITPKFLSFSNPATGETFGQVAMATPSEVERAMTDMRAAAPEWAGKSIKERVRILRQFQHLLIEATDEITATLNKDCGKSRQDGLIEVFMVVDMLNEYCKHARSWLSPYKVPSGLYFFKRSYVMPRPFGVVAVLAPWNYPFDLAMTPVLSALLAGNTVVLKPSEVTAATGVLMEALFKRVPELAPYVRVLHGDGSVGAQLVAAGADYIFVTGSTATGRKVLQSAASSLTPVGLELGGKDAVIVLEDADVEKAAYWSVWGANFNAGQTCMAVERAYVVEPVYDEFVKHAVEFTRQLKVGFTTDADCPYYLGPVTDPRQIEIIEHQLQDARARGAEVLVGGHRSGMFFEPTVLVNVDHDMVLMQEETFGPLLPIVQVKDTEEAIALANDNHMGLGASVWSKNIGTAEAVAHRLEAASILINDTIAQFAMPMVPFGGVKASGYGRTHGKEGLMQFTRAYAYVVGQPPLPFDLTVIARKPGHYQMLSLIMHVVFGTTLSQKLQPVRHWFKRDRTPQEPAPCVVPLESH